VGLPNADGDATKMNRALNEERVERDAWQGILNALSRLKATQTLPTADVSDS
jgi:hypothetical protein